MGLIQNELKNISGVRQKKSVAQSYTASKALGQISMPECANTREIKFQKIEFLHFHIYIYIIFFARLKHSIGKLAGFSRQLIT